MVRRDEAKAQGLRYYFTGEPCVNGHVEERNTKSGQCTACVEAKRVLREKASVVTAQRIKAGKAALKAERELRERQARRARRRARTVT